MKFGAVFSLSLLRLYRAVLSPFMHSLAQFGGLECRCTYEVTCSKYAEVELKKSGLSFSTVFWICLRFVSCGPWHRLIHRLPFDFRIRLLGENDS